MTQANLHQLSIKLEGKVGEKKETVGLVKRISQPNKNLSLYELKFLSVWGWNKYSIMFR